MKRGNANQDFSCSIIFVLFLSVFLCIAMGQGEAAIAMAILTYAAVKAAEVKL